KLMRCRAAAESDEKNVASLRPDDAREVKVVRICESGDDRIADAHRRLHIFVEHQIAKSARIADANVMIERILFDEELHPGTLTEQRFHHRRATGCGDD